MTLGWYFYDTSRKLQLSEFVWTLRSSVWVVFNHFLLIDATDKSKIRSDQKRLFSAVSLYPLSFFANTPFNFCFRKNIIASFLNQFKYSVWISIFIPLKIVPQSCDAPLSQTPTKPLETYRLQIGRKKKRVRKFIALKDQSLDFFNIMKLQKFKPGIFDGESWYRFRRFYLIFLSNFKNLKNWGLKFLSF